MEIHHILNRLRALGESVPVVMLSSNEGYRCVSETQHQALHNAGIPDADKTDFLRRCVVH